MSSLPDLAAARVDWLPETASADGFGCLVLPRPAAGGGRFAQLDQSGAGGGGGWPVGTSVVIRAPRIPPPRLPGGELQLEPPPEPARVVPSGPMSKLLPAAMLLGSLGFVVVIGPGNPTAWLFGGMFAISTLGMMAGGTGRGAGARRAEADEDRRDYLRYLEQQRRRVRAVAAQQRAALEWLHPEPAAWPSVLDAGRLWERRASEDDFGRLRIGLAAQGLATRLVPPQTGPVDALEPVTALALRRFLRAHSVVEELPVALGLRGAHTVWLKPASAAAADVDAARGLARALIAQYVLWHSPADAVLAVVARRSSWPVWDWTKWLPHAQHPTHTDAVGPLRMLTDTPDDVEQWWDAEFARRASAPGGADPVHPHLLIVLDGVPDGPHGWAEVAGVTLLRIGPAPSPSDVEPSAGPGSGRPTREIRLRVRPGAFGGPDLDGRVDRDQPQSRWSGRPDSLTVTEAAALARRLARYRPSRLPEPADGPPLRATVGLPELIGINHPAAIDAVRHRWLAAPADRLRVPIGIGEHGNPVMLDLKESAQGGFGPHGLCIGATGSGKSELLRTLVLGLAATHSSAALNMVLVDFKGGATFLGLADLPHVSAVITNLVDELSLVDRMADALAGEITRRQELLRAAGNLAGVADYERARQRGAELPTLPALLVVVDEFSELLAQRPDLVDEFVTIGRLGRSLQIHLLLASQRLDEGRLRGLESHLSYRIALRTFSATESRAVLGVPDAHHLPPTPGSAYLAVGNDQLIRFRAAYVSAPFSGPVAANGVAHGGAHGGAGRRRPLLFTAAPVHHEPGPRIHAAAPASRNGSSDATPSVLDAMVAAMAGQGPPAHQVWLPPLAEAPALGELLGELRTTTERGLSVVDRGGVLRVPVGLIDRPYQQRTDPLVADLSGPAGHVGVAGAVQSGKSTLLATLLLGLALRHTPAELSIYALDFGGGTFGTLAELPHVGAVADRQQPDLVRRTVAEVVGVLAERERLFRSAGIGSMVEYRLRRAAGEFADEPHGDLLLVIDGYLSLRSDFEELEAKLLPLATRGLSYGVHLVVSATRWSELRPALKDLLGTRFELRLGDPSDSEVDRRRAADVPTRPGHGLAADGAHTLTALPLLPGVDGPAAAVAAAWNGERAPAVRLLPQRLDHAELMALAGPPESGRRGELLPIGVDEVGLEPVHLDFRAEPHLLCFADGESGKTALLRLIARGLTDRLPPERARIVLLDYRRTLLGAISPAHLIGYASTASAAAAAISEVAESLRARLPGPDVTPRQLRARSWWQGPEVYVLVDDYDLVAPTVGGGTANPLHPLLEFLPQAKDVGLHLVLVRRSGGAGRALFEPVIARLRELAAPAWIGSGSPDEGALVDVVKPSPQPPGRGSLVSRRSGVRRVQLAWLAPESDGDGEPG